MRQIDYIVIHCSATKEGFDISVEDVRSWHLQRGWSDIGYHYFIDIHGKLEYGRPVSLAGAHVKGNNHNSIGICYAGGLDANGDPADTRTGNQQQTMLNLLYHLREQYPKAKILGHRDFANVAKECPCFDAQLEYEGV